MRTPNKSDDIKAKCLCVCEGVYKEVEIIFNQRVPSRFMIEKSRVSKTYSPIRLVFFISL